MRYNFKDQEMGIAPLIPAAVAALPTVANIVSDIFGKKKKKVTKPVEPPKPKVPTWVWIAGTGVVTLLGTTLVVTMMRRRRR